MHFVLFEVIYIFRHFYEIYVDKTLTTQGSLQSIKCLQIVYLSSMIVRKGAIYLKINKDISLLFH
jgi:hypothetical protein